MGQENSVNCFNNCLKQNLLKERNTESLEPQTWYFHN